jgi:hypothetical protein
VEKSSIKHQETNGEKYPEKYLENPTIQNKNLWIIISPKIPPKIP